MTNQSAELALEALLERVALGDQKAFYQLYSTSSPKLFAISLRITRQAVLSEEVLQDSFVKIWDNASQFDAKKAKAITWMGTIVRNQSIDAIRKNKKHTEGHGDYQEEINPADFAQNEIGFGYSEDSAPELATMVDEQLQVVNTCMGQLGSQYRDAIMLAYLDGYTHQEIAHTMQQPAGTIKTWIHRGVKNLRACIKKFEEQKR